VLAIKSDEEVLRYSGRGSTRVSKVARIRAEKALARKPYLRQVPTGEAITTTTRASFPFRRPSSPSEHLEGREGHPSSNKFRQKMKVISPSSNRLSSFDSSSASSSKDRPRSPQEMATTAILSGGNGAHRITSFTSLKRASPTFDDEERPRTTSTEANVGGKATRGDSVSLSGLMMPATEVGVGGNAPGSSPTKDPSVTPKASWTSLSNQRAHSNQRSSTSLSSSEAKELPVGEQESSPWNKIGSANKSSSTLSEMPTRHDFHSRASKLHSGSNEKRSSSSLSAIKSRTRSTSLSPPVVFESSAFSDKVRI